MAVIAGFTVEAGLFKSLVSAWLTVSDEVCWLFTRKDLHGSAMAPGRAHMVEFSLFPLDYRSETDRLWVRAVSGEIFAKTVARFKRGQEVRVEVRDDNKFYIGPFSVGDVMKEEEVWEDFKLPHPKVTYDATLKVLAENFRRIVKRAEEEKVRDYGVSAVYENIGVRVGGREATIIFFNEKDSRIDLKGYEPWVVNIEGDAKSVYSLPLFSSLVVLGLSEILSMRFQNLSVVEFSYSGSDFWLTYWLAPRVNKPFERFDELLVKPKIARKTLWVLRGDDVESFENTVRAIEGICRAETFNVAMTGEDLWLYWKEYDKGYFRVSRARFWEWTPLGERVSGVFNISEFARWIRDVEELSCLVEGEPTEAIVFVGKGEKIAEKELRSKELIKEIEVPEVRGIEVFRGPTATYRDVLSEAEAAKDVFLLFVAAPFEIIVLGRDTIYYRASLPVDAFKVIEEDYVPVNEGYFRGLETFFTSFPSAYATIGKQDNNIYLVAESTLGDLRALIIQTDTEVEEAVKAFTEEFLRPKPPPTPPEVKPLVPPAKPLKEELMKEALRFIGSGRSYEDLLADWKKFYPEWMEDWLKDTLNNLIEEKKIVVTAPGFYAPVAPPPPVIPPVEKAPPPPIPLEELLKEADKILETLPESDEKTDFRNMIEGIKKGLAVGRAITASEIENLKDWVDRLRKPEEVRVKVLVTPGADKGTYVVHWFYDKFEAGFIGVMHTENLKSYLEEGEDWVDFYEQYKLSGFENGEIAEYLKELPYPFSTPYMIRVWWKYPEDVTFEPEAKEWWDIYYKTYSRGELEEMMVPQLENICEIKKLRKGKKGEMVDAILGIKPPPLPPAPPPAVPPPLAPPVVPPKKELTKEEVSRLEDEFKAHLMVELGRIPKDVMAIFRVTLEKVKTLPFEKALEEILGAAREIVVRETMRVRLPPPRRPPPPAVPVVAPPERIVRIGIPEERPPEGIPVPPPAALPAVSPSPLPFPRRPTTEEKDLLLKAFNYEVASLGMIPSQYYTSLRERMFEWMFSSWENLRKEFDKLIEDIRTGVVMIRVPVIPWATTEEAILHFFAIGWGTAEDIVEELFLGWGIRTTKEEVVRVVTEAWKAKVDPRLTLITEEDVKRRLG